MIENINIAVPNEYLMTGMSVYNFYAAAEYQENYDKNINMLFGMELDIYKYSSIFAEIKFINSLIFHTGIKVKF